MDDHAGRILVKMALGSSQEWLNEFMVQPVSREEFTKYAKVINSAKYEEYKILQDKKLAMQKIKMEKDDIPLTSSRDRPTVNKETHIISDSDSDHRNQHLLSRNRSSQSMDRTKSSFSKTHKDDQTRNASPEWGAPSRQRHSRSDDEDRFRRDRSSNQYDEKDRRHVSRSDNLRSNTVESSRKSKSSRNRHRSASSSEERKSSRKPKSNSRRDESRYRSSSPDSEVETDRKKTHHQKLSKHKSSHKKKSKSRRESRSPPRSYSGSDSIDDHRYKKKSKKSKRERSRSRQR